MKCRVLALVLLLAAACTSERAAQPRPSPSPSPSSSSPTGTTSPSPSALRFAVIGDWGAGTAQQRAIALRMCAERARLPFSIVVTTGDNFYSPDGRATRRTYDEPERCLIDARVRWRAVWGNHDVAGSSTATVLGSRDRWFAWSEGAVDFFMLDSNQPRNQSQRAWLERALARSTARVKIAVFHHPPYTAGYHPNNTAVQGAWVPLFRQHDVTLVLSGHNHDYEHARVDGIDYVVSGGGGASTYPCLGKPAYVLVCKRLHHFLLVTVEGARVSVRAIAADGSTADSFTI